MGKLASSFDASKATLVSEFTTEQGDFTLSYDSKSRILRLSGSKQKIITKSVTIEAKDLSKAGRARLMAELGTENLEGIKAKAKLVLGTSGERTTIQKHAKVPENYTFELGEDHILWFRKEVNGRVVASKMMKDYNRPF